MALQSHGFSGNVRELENILKEAIVICDTRVIDGFISERVQKSANETHDESTLLRKKIEFPFNLQKEVDKFEKKLLLKAAHKCRTKSELAKSVGLSQPTAFRKLQKYSISVKKTNRP